MQEITLVSNKFTAAYSLVVVYTLGWRQNRSEGVIVPITYSGSGTKICDSSIMKSTSNPNYYGTHVVIISNVNNGDSLVFDNTYQAMQGYKILGC